MMKCLENVYKFREKGPASWKEIVSFLKEASRFLGDERIKAILKIIRLYPRDVFDSIELPRKQG